MRRPTIASIIAARSVSADLGEQGHVAVAQDLDAVGDGRDLVEPVGDVDDRDALVAQPPDEREEALRLVMGERGGRLVEDQQPGRSRQGAGDLDDLPLADAQRRHESTRVDVDVELLEDLAGPSIDARASRRRPNRLGSRPSEMFSATVSVGRVLELLEDDGDAEVAGGDRGQRRVGDLVDDDLAPVGRVVAGDDLDERGLAGPVLTEQGQHGAADGVEVHPVEDLDATERLADASAPGGRRSCGVSLGSTRPHQQAGVSG